MIILYILKTTFLNKAMAPATVLVLLNPEAVEEDLESLEKAGLPEVLKETSSLLGL